MNYYCLDGTDVLELFDCRCKDTTYVCGLTWLALVFSPVHLMICSAIVWVMEHLEAKRDNLVFNATNEPPLVTAISVMLPALQYFLFLK
jgi:hypothetical protein